MLLWVSKQVMEGKDALVAIHYDTLHSIKPVIVVLDVHFSLSTR